MTFTLSTFIVSHFAFGFLLGVFFVLSGEFDRRLEAMGRGDLPKSSVVISKLLTVIASTLLGSFLIAAHLRKEVKRFRERRLHKWSVVDCIGHTVAAEMTFKEAEALAKLVATMQSMSGHEVTHVEVNADDHVLTIKTSETEGGRE